MAPLKWFLAHGLAAGLASLALAANAHAQRPAPAQAATGAAPLAYTFQLPAESRSQALCEAEPDRIFVRHAQGSECIAYYATNPMPIAGRARSPAGAASAAPEARPAIFYFEGDVPAADLARPGFTSSYLAQMRLVFHRLAAGTGVRFVFIARPGVFGSSGSHAFRRSPGEVLAMNAAVDGLKARLGISSIVLAGQSGGSTVAASLLTLGRQDVACAVLGSGLLSVVEVEYAHRARERLPEIKPALLQAVLYDPSQRLDAVPPAGERRIFVLGDPTDARTPFGQQRAFADRLSARGHHALAIEVSGSGEFMHSVSHHTLPAAAHCALGVDDAAMRRLLVPQRTAAQTVVSQSAR